MSTEKNVEQSVPILMSGLREIMAKEMSATKRLNAVLTLLCEQLHMPTAVLYMMRPGDVLERYMLVGRVLTLPNFVRIGEDIVGRVALNRKVDLEQRTSSYKTILAVPVIRGNELIAVLELLSKRNEVLPPELVEAVQNVTMVLAEFLMELAVKNTANPLRNVPVSRILEGNELVRGFALGEALIHRRLDVSGPILTAHPDKEVKSLGYAFSRVQGVIKRRLMRLSTPPEEKEIFETYLLFLNDETWKSKVVSVIQTGLTAQAALQKVGDEMLDEMRSISDAYLKERARDFQDLVARLMQALLKKSGKKKLTGNRILVADTLGAAELLDYDLKHIKGIILEDSSQTSHVVIVARAYRIPLIGSVKGALKTLEEAAPVAFDTVRGRVYLRPSDETLDELKNHKKLLQKIERVQNRNKEKNSETKDGVSISLMVNLGISGGVEKLPFSDGVGLYRTELLFMTTKSLPDVKNQTDAYKRVIAMARNKPVVFRTLDIGSDKVLPYFEKQNEENPAMGWRSIRMVLDRRALLRNQLRALLRATAGTELCVMFPMISEVVEFIEAKKTLKIEVKNAMMRKEKLPTQIKVGTMLEVPSLIFQLDNLLPLVDFISIGTNDLAQFMFAADRTNPQISSRYDVLSPAFLRALKYVIEKCEEYHVKCSVCGEMASRPLEALALIALGGRCLSMSPEALGAIKTAIRSVNLKQFKAYLFSLMESCCPSLRKDLFSYLRDHHVEIGEIK